MKIILILLCFGLSFALFGDEQTHSSRHFGIEQKVVIDLRNPEIHGSSLYTEEGGVVQGSNIRIQAQKITYLRIGKEESVHAQNNVIVDYGDYHIVADAIYYDFANQEGLLTIARSHYGLWYFGGNEVALHKDGSLTLQQGYLTTSDLLNKDWKLDIQRAHLSSNHHLQAQSILFYAGNLPFFYLPKFKTSLDWITHHPFRYRLRWGGKQGLRFGITYLAYEWVDLKTYVRVDYRIKRGLGGGIETLWKPNGGAEHFHSVNYIAQDTSLEKEDQKTRYRIEGGYHGSYHKEHTLIDFSYDRVSDEEMPNDYYDSGLALDTVCRTEFHMRHQKENQWLANFYSRLRINNFQTVKQELPSLSFSHHPFKLGPTGLIMENTLNMGYLNFRFAHKQQDCKNFESSRFEWHHHLYRPLHHASLTLTPQAHYHAIFYGTTPQTHNQWLHTATFGAELRSSFHRFFRDSKHVIEPYLNYTWITTPSLALKDHYIFDVRDGQHALQALRCGVHQFFYVKTIDGIKQCLYCDLFAYAFFNAEHISTTIPKVYQETRWNLSDTLQQSFDFSWDFVHKQIAHINVRTEWSVSEDFALRAEYRHRNAYDWRKADAFNFILEASRHDESLAESFLSDQRDTLLCHFFYRLQYNVTAEFQFRHGWNRKQEPCYTEYQIDLTTTLRSHWNIRISWQNREHDHRLVFNISLGK